MKYWLHITRAHFTAEFITLLRYPFDLASMYVIATLLLAGIFLGVYAFVPAGHVMGSTMAAVYVGYIFWTFYVLTVSQAALEIKTAADKGYIEREFLTPAGHGATVVAKIFATSATGLFHYAAISVTCALIFRIKLAVDIPSILFIFFFCYIFLAGLGLTFAGLALVFKRVGNLLSVTKIALMVLSFAALGSYHSAAETALSWFPYTHSIRLLRAVLVEGESFSHILKTGNVVPLAVASVAFFAAGLIAFRQLDRAAMNRGLIGQF
jgi:ABC-2 type transport system permease protein